MMEGPFVLLKFFEEVIKKTVLHYLEDELIRLVLVDLDLRNIVLEILGGFTKLDIKFGIYYNKNIIIKIFYLALCRIFRLFLCNLRVLFFFHFQRKQALDFLYLHDFPIYL